MKKAHQEHPQTKKVFALGNALIDLEYKVTNEILSATDIPKGSSALAMTLAEQQRIIKILEDHNIALKNKVGGGCSPNTIFAVAALGGKASLSCCVANDDEGRFYLEDLKSAGVEVSDIALRDGVESTGSCLILITPDAERTMQSYLGATEHYAFEHVDQILLADADYVYIEGYLAASDLAIDAVKKVKETAREQKMKIALSFVDPSMVEFFKDGLLSMLDGGVDILFCNAEEATSFSETNNVADAAKKLHVYSDTIVITLGADGVYVSDKNQAAFKVNGKKVDKLVDTNGAGDNFAGAFLYAQSSGMNLEDSAKLAVQVSAKLVTDFGPRMHKDDYQQVLANFKKQKALKIKNNQTL